MRKISLLRCVYKTAAKRFLCRDKLVSNMKVVVILCSIVVLFNWPVDSRLCYQCSCDYEAEDNYGSCILATFPSSCVLTDVGNQYCLITSVYSNTYERRIFGSVARDTFQDSHFIQAVESISRSGGVWLPTTISLIGYGCDWDGCNNISLVQDLPGSFNMAIDPAILEAQLIGGQLQANFCESCSKCFNDLTGFACAQTNCSSGICAIDDIHNYITTQANNCTYNFFSSCEPLADPPQPPSVRIRANYYIDLPQATQLEIDEVDIRCTKERCNSLLVAENLKPQIRAAVSIPDSFQPVRPTGSKSTTSYPIGVLYLLMLPLLLL